MEPCQHVRTLYTLSRYGKRGNQLERADCECGRHHYPDKDSLSYGVSRAFRMAPDGFVILNGRRFALTESQGLRIVNQL